MFIKLLETGKEVDNFNNHLFEADHIHYRWQEEEERPPALYFVPFERGADEHGEPLMVISLYDRGSLTEKIVAFNCAVYVMNEQGKTVDKFAV